MPMHEKQRGTYKNLGAMPKIQQPQNHGLSRRPNKQPPDRSQPPQQLTDQLSAMTLTDQITSSWKRIVKHMCQQTTYNVWIGTSHVCLPTFWCSKCNKWTSHHDKLNDKRTRWQAMKDAQTAKQDEYRKLNQQNRYSSPYQQNRK
jgi:hypothetical protein